MPRKRISVKQRILNGLEGRSLVFLGMMGSGKSAIGRMVARRLGLSFLDADSEIEKAADMSIPEIFNNYGEPEFRRLEVRVIERVLEEGQIVLALGGGAYMAEDVRKAISKNSIAIWLKADLDLLLKRVMQKPGKRPMLANGDPKDILQNLMAARDPGYALSDLHVSSISGTKADMRNHVLNRLITHLEGCGRSISKDHNQ